MDEFLKWALAISMFGLWASIIFSFNVTRHATLEKQLAAERNTQSARLATVFFAFIFLLLNVVKELA
jgi:hypothetical protein